MNAVQFETTAGKKESSSFGVIPTLSMKSKLASVSQQTLGFDAPECLVDTRAWTCLTDAAPVVDERRAARHDPHVLIEQPVEADGLDAELLRRERGGALPVVAQRQRAVLKW